MLVLTGAMDACQRRSRTMVRTEEPKWARMSKLEQQQKSKAHHMASYHLQIVVSRIVPTKVPGPEEAYLMAWQVLKLAGHRRTQPKQWVPERSEHHRQQMSEAVMLRTDGSG